MSIFEIIKNALHCLLLFCDLMKMGKNSRSYLQTLDNSSGEMQKKLTSRWQNSSSTFFKLEACSLDLFTLVFIKADVQIVMLQLAFLRSLLSLATSRQLNAKKWKYWKWKYLQQNSHSSNSSCTEIIPSVRILSCSQTMYTYKVIQSETLITDQ